MAIFRQKKRTRACVVGLDGVPHGMLADLAARDVMPAMARLVDSGHLHQMKASLPEISAVSWTNFMTGANSGTHGIFGFVDFKPDSYSLRFPSFTDVRTPPFWNELGDRGLQSIILNQPATYPARRVNGALISGFVAIDLGRAVYPASWLPALEKIGYRIDIDTLRSRDDHAFFWDELAAVTSGREKALDLFWRQPWDYFEFVVTGTDRLHHFLWPAYEDSTHPDHGRFLDYYRRVDRMIEKTVKSFTRMTGGLDGLFVLSDHGFTGIVQEVYLNAWLREHGYLDFTTAEPQGLEDISPKTKAFALDPNRVYLNLKHKFPRGTVVPAEGAALRKEIAAGLEALEFEGRKVVRRVYLAGDVYTGPHTAKGPDLIVLGEPGFDMKGSVKKKEIFGRTALQGMHTWDDAFFWSSAEAGPELAIEEVAGLILNTFS